MLSIGRTSPMPRVIRCAVLALVVTVLPASAAVEEIPDDDLRLAVEAELLASEAVAAHRVDVAVDDGVVTLDGEVGHLLAQQRAVALASALKGVRSIVDALEVHADGRSDSLVQADVTRSLVADPATEAFEIDVDVAGGVVTLEGTVDSRAEKLLAGDVAAATVGVRGLDNRIDVGFVAKRTDADIAADVRGRLRRDVRIDQELIDVDVTGGIVHLAGAVASLNEKNLSRRKAWVPGARDVRDTGLQVEWWAGDEDRRIAPVGLSDSQVVAAVTDALQEDPRVWSFDVRPSVDDGVVTLSGRVDNLKASAAAVEAALNTTGVWRVRNHIRVRPAMDVGDRQLARYVNEALLRNPFVERHEIDVVADNGRILLYGQVDSDVERREAQDAAARILGVTAVDNRLHVHIPAQRKEDWELRADVEDALYWDPIVDQDDIDVRVDDGIVTLDGSVATHYEWSVARDAALDAGARKVDNELSIEGAGPFLDL